MTRTKSRCPVVIEPLSVAEPERMTASPVCEVVRRREADDVADRVDAGCPGEVGGVDLAAGEGVAEGEVVVVDADDGVDAGRRRRQAADRRADVEHGVARLQAVRLEVDGVGA